MSIYDPREVTRIAASRREWERTNFTGPTASSEVRSEFKTMSGIPVERLYTPEDVASLDYLQRY